MSCRVCNGLRQHEGGGGGHEFDPICRETEECVRAAPYMFTAKQRIDAGVPRPADSTIVERQPRVSGCRSSECAIRQTCTGSSACPRPALELAKRIATNAIRARAEAQLMRHKQPVAALDRGKIPPQVQFADGEAGAEAYAREAYAAGNDKVDPFEPLFSGDMRPRDIYGEVIADGRVGAWMQTARGGQMWPLDPRPEDIHILDVARGIANCGRYGSMFGRRGCWYSVAEHSVLVASFVATLYPDHPEWEQEALLHDGSEAYGFRDVPRPLKHDPEIRAAVERVENPWALAIYAHYGINSTLESQAAIKRVDNLILLDEIPALMRKPEMYESRHPFDSPDRLHARILCMQPVSAELWFLGEFRRLFPAFEAEALEALRDEGCP